MLRITEYEHLSILAHYTCSNNPLADRDAHCIYNEPTHQCERGRLQIDADDSAISQPSAETSGFQNTFSTFTVGERLSRIRYKLSGSLISRFTSGRDMLADFMTVYFMFTGVPLQHKSHYGPLSLIVSSLLKSACISC